MAIVLDAIRSASRDTADAAQTDDRIPLALSSETAVERWFGEEILDHSAKAVDLSRAAGGLPLLLDHSTRDQIGVIEEVEIGSDKVMRGLMRFSKSARATEIRQDVLDGIRTRASIGYQIRELVLEKSDKKGTDTYRATSWMPLEGSIVAVPADPTVGVGRSADEGTAFPVRIITPPTPAPKAKEHTVENTNTAATNGAAPTVEVRDRNSAAPADTRAADLAALARQYKATELLPEWIGSGKTVEEARTELLDRIAKNVKPMLAPVVELSDKEKRNYSLVRALFAAAENDWSKAGFEREVSVAIEKGLPDTYRKQGAGFFMPTTIHSRAGLDSATATKGSELKFTEQGEFIDMLRNRMKTIAMGARVLSGLVGPVSFPKQTGAGTFAWVGENPLSDVAESNLLLGSVALNPRTGQSTTSFSKQLVAQVNNPDVETLVREDLAKIHALGIDLAGINGSGASNQPTGVLNTSGIGSVAIGTNGGAPTWEHIIDLETAVAAANADVDAMGYLTTPGIRGKLKKTQRFSGTDGGAIWADGTAPLNGYRAEVSAQVPSTLTKGTSADCHAVIFGDWSQLVYGEWGALEILVDPYRLKKQAMIEVTSFQMVGIAVRIAEAFAAIKDARTV